MVTQPVLGPTTPLVSGKWMSLCSTEVTHPAQGGKPEKTGAWQWVTRGAPHDPKPPTKPNAVVIAATYVDVTPRMVVTKEFRIPINAFEWGFPAGLVDGDESIEDAVRRELKEETGLTLHRITQVSPLLISSAGLSDESVVIAFCEVYGEPSPKHLETGEYIETFLLDHAELHKAAQQGLWGSKAWPIVHLLTALTPSLSPVRPSIFTFTALTLREDGHIQHSRTFGWESTWEAAISTVLAKGHSMEECRYTHIVVEAVNSGLHGMSTKEAWFTVHQGVVTPIEKPKTLEGCINFAIG